MLVVFLGKCSGCWQANAVDTDRLRRGPYSRAIVLGLFMMMPAGASLEEATRPGRDPG